jgi:hypothetical protein
VPKTKPFTKSFVPQRDKDQKNLLREWKGKPKLDDDKRRELMRKKLCFSSETLGSLGIDAWGRDRSTILKWNQAVRRRMRIFRHRQTVIQRLRPLMIQSSSRRNLRYRQGHSPRRRQNLVER